MIVRRMADARPVWADLHELEQPAGRKVSGSSLPESTHRGCVFPASVRPPFGAAEADAVVNNATKVSQQSGVSIDVRTVDDGSRDSLLLQRSRFLWCMFSDCVLNGAASDAANYDVRRSFASYLQVVQDVYPAALGQPSLPASELPFVPTLFPLPGDQPFLDWTLPFQPTKFSAEVPQMVQACGVFALKFVPGTTRKSSGWAVAPPGAVSPARGAPATTKTSSKVPAITPSPRFPGTRQSHGRLAQEEKSEEESPASDGTSPANQVPRSRSPSPRARPARPERGGRRGRCQSASPPSRSVRRLEYTA